MSRKEYTKAEREAILNLYDNQCQNCGSTKNLQIHHIVPIGNGGNETLGNLTVLCLDCHKKVHKAFNNHSGVGKSNGRKSNIRCADWEDVLVAYARCELSACEAKILLNMSQKSHIKDKSTKWAYESLLRHGISGYANMIDYLESSAIHKTLQDGDFVGYVAYVNGNKEEILYDSSKRGKWKIRVNQIKEANNMKKQANTIISEALKVPFLD